MIFFSLASSKCYSLTLIIRWHLANEHTYQLEPENCIWFAYEMFVYEKVCGLLSPIFAP